MSNCYFIVIFFLKKKKKFSLGLTIVSVLCFNVFPVCGILLILPLFYFSGKSETTVCQNGKAHSLNSAIKSTDVIVKSECQPDIAQAVSEVPDTKIQAVSEASDTKIQAVSEASDTKIQAVSEDPDTNTQKEEVKKSKGERGRRHFGKLFKKKTEPKAEAETVEEKEKETQSEDQVDVSVPPTEPQQVRALFMFILIR